MDAIGVILQARFSSGRLRGKALVDVAGKPLLRRLYDRMRTCRDVVTVFVATGDGPADDAIAAACADWGVPVYRGPELDLTTRLLGACRAHGLSAFVRATGDNPLTDPEGVEALIATHRRTGKPYVHNAHRRGYPYGTGADVIAVSALETCDRDLVEPAQRESFIAHFRAHPERFPCVRVPAPSELVRPDLFLTVDYPEDLELVSRVFSHFGGRDDVPVRDVVAWLDREPELASLNRHLHDGFTD